MYHKDSKSLIQFIKVISKNFINNGENLSKTSEIFIEKILGWMEDASLEFGKTNIEERRLDNQKEVPRGTHFLHIPEEIQEHLERMDWIGKKINFSIKSRTFHIYFVHPTQGVKESEILTWMKQITKKIYNWLYIASHQGTQGCSKDLSIYMYFTGFKKKLPPSKKPMDEMNVNTAYTFSCKLRSGGENEMYIYRKEEWFKVFIHETFHSFALDFSSLPNTTQKVFDKKILQIFPLKIDLRFYETYCEMWAEILNIIYIVFENVKGDLKIKIRKITEHLELEHLFSLFQTSKILKSMQISYCELYEDSVKARHKRILNYKEDSPIMSYYVLKCIFMLHFGEFIEWCIVNNKGSLNFRKTESNLESYVEFIGKRYKSPQLLQELSFMDEYHNVLQKKKIFGEINGGINGRMNGQINGRMNGENDGSFNIMQSLRMSMFESSST
jgi:hypothetical protein